MRVILLLLAGCLCQSLVVPVQAQTQPDYNRAMSNVALLPSSAGPDYDVRATWTLAVNQDQSVPIDLGTEVVLRINGIEVSSTPNAALVDAGTGAGTCSGSCTGTCGSINGTIGMNCVPSDVLGLCDCRSINLVTTFPSVPLRPADEIMVLLRPAPGALPELPGFEDDDQSIAPPIVRTPLGASWMLALLTATVMIAALLLIRRRRTVR